MNERDALDLRNTTGAQTMSSDQFQSFVVDYNNSAAPYPEDKTVIQLFESQVQRTPDEEAILEEDLCLTYREVDNRSNKIATQIYSEGVCLGQPIVILMERTADAVCSILAVLKLGCVYVPVDPSTPRDRLKFVLRDIGIEFGKSLPIMVTQPHFVSSLPSDYVRIVSVENSLDNFEDYMVQAPRAQSSSNHLAYILYTSGSTGEPKGVMVEHRSLTNYVWWAKKKYDKGERLTWPLFTSFAFDLTVTSIFTPLISGGRIVVYTGAGGNGSVIFRVVEDGLANIVKLTPSHLEMVKELNLQATSIQRIIVGGEEFKANLARDISNRFGRPVEIYNEYGPTEATVGCMIHQYDQERDLGSSVPIGIPAANAGVFILDEKMNPVAPNVTGEMYLAGVGLARGYFNREELTAQKFIEARDPRQEQGTSSADLRLYKTGDIARWNTNGQMEYLGRTDHQVKIGGMRIELGEIEASITKIAEISECVVVVKNGDSVIKTTNYNTVSVAE